MINIFTIEHSSPKQINDEIITPLKEYHFQYAQTSIEQIISILGELELIWKLGGEFSNKAKEYLEANNIMSNSMIKESLKVLPDLFNIENLKLRVKAEFKNLKCLDEYSKLEGYEGEIYHAPLGLVLHVTAGNVFLGAIDSLLMGILTKNCSIVKLSQSNLYLPNLFLESLKQVDTQKIIVPSIKLASFKGGNKIVEAELKQHVDGIIAWGGEEMIESYSSSLPSHVKLIQHGPKISFHVICKKYLENHSNSYEQIVNDIIFWDQQACANSQNIYLQEGIDEQNFLKCLESTFLTKKVQRSKISPDEAVELLKQAQESLYYEFETGKESIINDNFQLVQDHGLLSPSALNNSVKIKIFSNERDLYQKLSPFKFYLQTCGLGAIGEDKKKLQKALSLAGVNRFTDLGKMLSSKAGTPHDGSYSLIDLTNICASEKETNIIDFIEEVDIPFYSEHHGQRLEDYPLIDSKTLEEHSLYKDDALVSSTNMPGYIFSSGGTTGNPKYCFYTNNEFKKVTDLLGKSYQNLGVEKYSKVANLFMAGNMWSSFTAIQDALKYCNAIQFPMGGSIKPEDFKFIVEKFDVKILFGLPGMLLNLANLTQGIKIDKIFYAGEAFTEEGLKFIKKAWNCSEIYSAGYASVDVGPIGYQTKDCRPGEHYLFSEMLNLEVINEEAVVTSTIRKKMPIIRYRTGDKVKVLEENNGKVKFKLLGRVDKKINIWSSRFELSDLAEILKINGGHSDFQVVLIDQYKGDHYTEMIEIRTPDHLNYNKFIHDFYTDLKDVSDTHSFEYISQRVKIENCSFLKNDRTGKLSKIIDLRS